MLKDFDSEISTRPALSGNEKRLCDPDRRATYTLHKKAHTSLKNYRDANAPLKHLRPQVTRRLLYSQPIRCPGTNALRGKRALITTAPATCQEKNLVVGRGATGADSRPARAYTRPVGARNENDSTKCDREARHSDVRSEFAHRPPFGFPHGGQAHPDREPAAGGSPRA